jgi:hypothetical protein
MRRVAVFTVTSPSSANITATSTVANSSKKPSTHRWMIQKRQLSITAKLVRGPKKSAGR